MAVAKALVTFGDLSWKGYFVMCSVLFSFVIMLLDIWTADMVMCFEVLLFLLLGILKPADALAGFSSSGVWSPAVMFMVAQGLSSTGGLDYIISKILGKPKDVTVGQIRLLLITLCFSSFVSDTAVTAIMIPIVIAYTQKARLPLKQFMSLLGYAALTGGTNTIIGTSTNLVISGMMNSRYGDKESPFFRPSYKPMSPFDLTPYGIQVSGWLIVWCILLSPLFLTDGEGWRKWINYFRRETLTSAWKAHQSFEVGLRVPPDSPAVGLTLLSAGLLDLNFLMPTRVVSSTGAERPNDPNTEIKPDDIIYFVGDITKIANVCLDGKGLGDALGDTKGLEIEAGGLVTKPRRSAPPPQMPTVGGPVNRGPPILFTARIRGPSDARRPVGGDDRYCLRRWYHSTAENAAAAAALGGSHLIGQPAAEATAAFDGRHVVPIGVARRVGTGKNAKLEQIKAPLESITLEAGDEILLQTSPTFWAGSPAVRAAAASCEHVRFTGVVNEYYYPLEVKGRLTRMIEGLTLKNAGLKGLAGANLVGLQHADQAEPMKALSEEEKLTAGDVLTFAGTDRAIELIRKNPGLELQNAPELGRLRDAVVDRNLAQAVVAPLSPLIGARRG
ncbi:divalent Anion:Na+ symporter family [Raphidocelis subcapitata]|uniref:Divalent Anion:Na+ symporter family n=1 Tax=Raphidocelis subcapitata TaxID=307507 RepID=A0A2V0P600_9CHLO|nr:divalent Anion:Na+ symporter family [Raphidocelis subcapitata]|eukprot:GBF95288.1 divalent Anion:Na+ symporter family [Raphidocelis subcapitata]